MQLHKFVCWWQAPELRQHSTMFLVKVLGRVTFRFDGLTARGTRGDPIRVRVCQHPVNAAHPSCGQEFLADAGDLIAVQYGHNHH